MLRLLVLSLFSVFLACSSCQERAPQHPPSGESLPSGGRQEAVDSGRAEILTFERRTERLGREGTMTVQRLVVIPQLVGDEPGLGRINGFLRHLALNWPDLPSTGQPSAAETAESMRALADLAATLGPADWPSVAQLESMETSSPLLDLGGEFQAAHDEASFTVAIIRLDESSVVLNLDLFDASGARLHHAGGGMTLDLSSGELTGFAAKPFP